MTKIPLEFHRTTRLNVRLSSEMMEKVDQVAKRMGLAGATIGAVAIAEYINKKSVETELMELIAEKTAAKGFELAEQIFADPERLALMANAVESSEAPKSP
jgi:predicted transcriptional regulator